MRNIYDNSEFFAAYAEMGRSKDGLKAAGEWHQLQPLFPKLQGKKVPLHQNLWANSGSGSSPSW